MANIPSELVPGTAAIPATSAPSTELNFSVNQKVEINKIILLKKLITIQSIKAKS